MNQPQIPLARWISNLVEVTTLIADRAYQEQRWLAPDRYVWERPEDLINDVDAYVLEGFIEEFMPTFSTSQREAAIGFKIALDDFCEKSPNSLDPVAVLNDDRWNTVRQEAAKFVSAFKGKWP
jgi:hypothetical protein